jgi:hypothetical protein
MFQWSARRTTFPASNVHTVAVSAVTLAPLPLPRAVIRVSTTTCRPLTMKSVGSARKSSQALSDASHVRRISSTPRDLPGAGQSTISNSTSESKTSPAEKSPRDHSSYTRRTISTFSCDIPGRVSRCAAVWQTAARPRRPSP